MAGLTPLAEGCYTYTEIDNPFAPGTITVIVVEDPNCLNGIPECDCENLNDVLCSISDGSGSYL